MVELRRRTGARVVRLDSIENPSDARTIAKQVAGELRNSGMVMAPEEFLQLAKAEAAEGEFYCASCFEFVDPLAPQCSRCGSTKAVPADWFRCANNHPVLPNQPKCNVCGSTKAKIVDPGSEVGRYECATCGAPIESLSMSSCPRCDGTKARVIKAGSESFECERCGFGVADPEGVARCPSCGHGRVVPRK